MRKKIIIFILVIMCILVIANVGNLIFQKNMLEEENNSLNVKLENAKNEINTLNQKQNELKNDLDDTLNILSDDSIFENTPTEGLNPISKETAVDNFNKYIEKNKILNDESNKNKQLIKIEIENQHPSNNLSYDVWKFNKQPRTADFTRKCYTLYYQTGDFDYLEGYVDYYTGKVIGGYLHGV